MLGRLVLCSSWWESFGKPVLTIFVSTPELSCLPWTQYSYSSPPCYQEDPIAYSWIHLLSTPWICMVLICCRPSTSDPLPHAYTPDNQTPFGVGRRYVFLSTPSVEQYLSGALRVTYWLDKQSCTSPQPSMISAILYATTRSSLFPLSFDSSSLQARSTQGPLALSIQVLCLGTCSTLRTDFCIGHHCQFGQPSASKPTLLGSYFELQKLNHFRVMSYF